MEATGENLLKGAGTRSHKQAMNKVENEYKKYQSKTLSQVEQDYLDSITELSKKRK